jgi:hypothetical protein
MNTESVEAQQAQDTRTVESAEATRWLEKVTKRHLEKFGEDFNIPDEEVELLTYLVLATVAGFLGVPAEFSFMLENLELQILVMGYVETAYCLGMERQECEDESDGKTTR